MKWISINKRLPKHNDIVLIYQDFTPKDIKQGANEDFRTTTAWFDGQYRNFKGWDDNGEGVKTRSDIPHDLITHWMPRPNPPISNA